MSVALSSVFVCVVYPGLFLNGIVLNDCPYAGCLLIYRVRVSFDPLSLLKWSVFALPIVTGVWLPDRLAEWY